MTAKIATYKIEKNVPFSQRRNKWGPLFGSMKPGDSFAAGRDQKSAQKVISSAYGYGKAHKQTYAYRKQEDGIIRVWRTK